MSAKKLKEFENIIMEHTEPYQQKFDEFMQALTTMMETAITSDGRIKQAVQLQVASYATAKCLGFVIANLSDDTREEAIKNIVEAAKKFAEKSREIYEKLKAAKNEATIN